MNFSARFSQVERRLLTRPHRHGDRDRSSCSPTIERRLPTGQEEAAHQSRGGFSQVVKRRLPTGQEEAAHQSRGGCSLHIWILATYDIVCHLRYRMSGHTILYVRCWMSYTISYIRYRIYDIALLDIRYRMCDIACFYDIVCQHAMSYV